LVALDAFGVDVGGWLGGLWDTLGAVSPAYLVAAIAVQTLQISLNALAWLYILRAGYPHAKIPYAPILTAYTVGNALNAVLPAKLGAFVMLFMFVAIIPGSTFAGVFAGFLVEKIFFTVTGVLVYVYLFIAVPGSFSVELGGLREHSWLTALIAIGAVALIVVLARVFWTKLRELWLQAKQGGAILSTPRRYLVQVVLPCLGGYIAPGREDRDHARGLLDSRHVQLDHARRCRQLDREQRSGDARWGRRDPGNERRRP
jgi:hypothetical protein